MTDTPKFGVWANVHGTMAALGHPGDPVDASWPRVREQVLLAERLGFASTLIAQHTMNPLGESLDQLDAWSAAAALAALTSSIEVIAAVKPSIIHPTVLAKQAQGIEEISEGRFALNVVKRLVDPRLGTVGDRDAGARGALRLRHRVATRRASAAVRGANDVPRKVLPRR